MLNKTFYENHCRVWMLHTLILNILGLLVLVSHTFSYPTQIYINWENKVDELKACKLQSSSSSWESSTFIFVCNVGFLRMQKLHKSCLCGKSWRVESTDWKKSWRRQKREALKSLWLWQWLLKFNIWRGKINGNWVLMRIDLGFCCENVWIWGVLWK